MRNEIESVVGGGRVNFVHMIEVFWGCWMEGGIPLDRLVQLISSDVSRVVSLCECLPVVGGSGWSCE